MEPKNAKPSLRTPPRFTAVEGCQDAKSEGKEVVVVVQFILSLETESEIPI